MDSFEVLSRLPVSKNDEPSEILPGVYLGGHPGRYDVAGKRMGLGYPARWLREELGVRLVVCCCASKNAARYILEDTDTCSVALFSDEEAFVEAATVAGSSSVGKVNLPIVDEDYFDASVYFNEACRLLRLWNEVRHESVLVHCQAGMSRSAAILTAYFLHRFGPEHWLPRLAASPARGAYDDDTSISQSVCVLPVGLDYLVAEAIKTWGPTTVIKFMEQRRICVDPNPGFRAQLEVWGAKQVAAVLLTPSNLEPAAALELPVTVIQPFQSSSVSGGSSASGAASGPSCFESSSSS